MNAKVKWMGNALPVANMVWALMQPEGATQDILVEISGFHVRTVRRYIRTMRRLVRRVVYIIDWNEDSRGQYTIPVYGLGLGRGITKDVPRPKLSREALLENGRIRARNARLAKKRSTSAFHQV